jgi:hypothetical protein
VIGVVTPGDRRRRQGRRLVKIKANRPRALAPRHRRSLRRNVATGGHGDREMVSTPHRCARLPFREGAVSVCWRTRHTGHGGQECWIHGSSSPDARCCRVSVTPTESCVALSLGTADLADTNDLRPPSAAERGGEPAFRALAVMSPATRGPSRGSALFERPIRRGRGFHMRCIRHSSARILQ